MTVKGTSMSRLTDADTIQLLTMRLRGDPIYVRFTKQQEMREGSIAIIKDWDIEKYLKKNGQKMVTERSYYPNRWHTPNIKTFTVDGDEYEVDIAAVGAFWGRVRWEGRKNECDASYYNVEWLKGYEGPCVWNYGTVKATKPQVVATDRLGRELKVGDFACYILHHFGHTYGASTQFGTITKIERDGTVWAKNVALGENETSAVKKINDNATIVILTKDLMDRLMMAKLATL